MEHYLPLFRPVWNDRNSLITDYFNLGLSYHEIAAFLASFHDVILSVRQVKRILRRLGLRRRLNQSNVGDVLHAVMHELNGSGSIVGYRAMHQRIQCVRSYYANQFCAVKISCFCIRFVKRLHG